MKIQSLPVYIINVSTRFYPLANEQFQYLIF